MIDQIAQNPTVTTVITMLLVTIVALLKGTVIPGTNVQKLIDKYDVQAQELEARIADERARADRWMEIAMRATGVADDLVRVAKTRQREGR